MFYPSNPKMHGLQKRSSFTGHWVQAAVYILLARVRTRGFKARAGDISARICGEVPQNNALCFSEILCG